MKAKTYDLINDKGEILFSGYPYADAVAEQKWRTMAGESSLSLVPHGKAKQCNHPPCPCPCAPEDL